MPSRSSPPPSAPTTSATPAIASLHHHENCSSPARPASLGLFIRNVTTYVTYFPCFRPSRTRVSRLYRTTRNTRCHVAHRKRWPTRCLLPRRTTAGSHPISSRACPSAFLLGTLSSTSARHHELKALYSVATSIDALASGSVRSTTNREIGSAACRYRSTPHAISAGTSGNRPRSFHLRSPCSIHASTPGRSSFNRRLSPLSTTVGRLRNSTIRSRRHRPDAAGAEGRWLLAISRCARDAKTAEFWRIRLASISPPSISRLRSSECHRPRSGSSLTTTRRLPWRPASHCRWSSRTSRLLPTASRKMLICQNPDRPTRRCMPRPGNRR